MNRVSLSVFAAALLFSCPGVIPAQEKTMTTSTGMELVWIPAGEFMMGSTEEERQWVSGSEGRLPASQVYESGVPQRTAIKSGFWMGRTELTMDQWKKFADASGYRTEGERQGSVIVPDPATGKWGPVKGASWKNPNFGFDLTDNYPACCITWNDAMAYCQWVTEFEKKAGRLPSGMVYRLPTEAEWEYACRAGTQTKFWWGDALEDGKGRMRGKFRYDQYPYDSPVEAFGRFGRNGFGLAGMLGNLFEWCLDDFDPACAHAPLYRQEGGMKVLRGGSFHEPAGYMRCAARYRKGTTSAFPFIGFRACCGVSDGSGEPSQNTGPIVAPVLPPLPIMPSPTVAQGTPPASMPPGPAKAPAAATQTGPPALHAVGVKQTVFEICGFSTSAQNALVNDIWTRNVSCVEATLRVNEEIGEARPLIKAYFYNKDRQMVREWTHPTSVCFGRGDFYQAPVIHKAGKKFTVYFAATESIQKGKDKWKHVIVMFGNRDNVTADIHPKEDIQQFDFPEKERVLKGMGR